MLPRRSRRSHAQLGAVRPDTLIKSGKQKTPNIFYDPDGVLADPGTVGNFPADSTDLDVNMEDSEERQSDKEQNDPNPPVAIKEELCRVYLKPRRLSSKKGARALLEMSVDALYPILPTDHTVKNPGAQNPKDLIAGKPSMLKTIAPAIMTTDTNSGGGSLRVSVVPVEPKDAEPSARIDFEKKDEILPKIHYPPASIESRTVSESEGNKEELGEDDDEENKENQTPPTILRGVNPIKDKGFADESPFGSDLAHLLVPCAQEPILANDPSSKLCAPISVNEAMVISKGKELGSVPRIREGVLGELSAEHLYHPETRGSVYIPSAGLPYRYDSSQHFVPTLTMESGLKDIKMALSNSDEFKIWEDGDGSSDDDRKDETIAGGVHSAGCGGNKDDDALDEDEYEALLKLHFGDGWTENIAGNPSPGTIQVRPQASSSVRITYNKVTESRRSVEDNTGSCSRPTKLRILHRSPGTDREVADNRTGMLAVKTASSVEVAVRRGTSTHDDINENAASLTDMDPFAALCGDENETPSGCIPIALHAPNNGKHLASENTMGIPPQKPFPSMNTTLPVALPHSPSAVSPALSPLTIPSPPDPNILNVTAATVTPITDNPLMPSFPASLKRSNSFREFRDPLASPPLQVPKSNRRHPTLQNDAEDDDRFGSLQSGSPHGTGGTHLAKTEGTGGHDNEEKLSQLNLI